MTRSTKSRLLRFDFSALGRAVWDETVDAGADDIAATWISVLSVEPYGMKLSVRTVRRDLQADFSALGRAVWDETV